MPAKKTTAASQEKNVGLAVVAYILFIVPLLLDVTKKDKFVQFHVVQSLGLLIFSLASSIIMIIPLLGWIVGGIGYLLVFIFWIIGIVNAANGKEKPLPLIGELSIKYLKLFISSYCIIVTNML